MADIKFEGLDDLKKGLAKKIQLTDVQKVVRHHGSELQKRMQNEADFTKGYATGTTKRSIGLVISDNRLTASVEPTTEYSPYLEYGTRFMEAQPFVKPAFDEQSKLFKDDLQKLVR